MRNPARRERTVTNPATGVASRALQEIAPAGSESDVMTNTDWQDWVGRAESHADVVTATPVAALAATLDRDDPPPRGGDPLPPLWHWLYFLPLARQSEIGPDGHSKRGGFLPPVPLPRRMWAGSRLSFLQPLRIGEPIERTSTIVDITSKEGRSGPLVFVRVRHAIASARGPAIVDEHDIVYREMPVPGERPATPPRAPGTASWTQTIRPDDVLLFRYSALTVQRSSDPLRSPLCHRSGRLPGSRRARAADRDAAARTRTTRAAKRDRHAIFVPRREPVVRRCPFHGQRGACGRWRFAVAVGCQSGWRTRNGSHGDARLSGPWHSGP